ncbi:unnamed protein product [Phytophthora lilii]|uniref:Unnamed protein product n=1 Tax=Phytophthora lilii TaxID=2077276 RepID=A0A9W7D8P0_9STRA|nr:unnamed protein product [Phytophthora lilii]
MDETAVFFEDPRNTTVDVTGSRHVVVRSTGFASMRVTVVLAVTASGRKVTPLVIWKNKRGNRSIKQVHSVLVAEQPKAWVDSDLLMNWIERAFPAVLAGEGQALVWDSMRAHISVKVKAKCAQKDIAMCVIPGGLTAYLQAGDIGIYKVFKNQLSDLIDTWKRSDQVTFTRGGKPRPPPVETVYDRVDELGAIRPSWLCKTQLMLLAFIGTLRPGSFWNHDVYGWKFQRAWNQQQQEEEEESNNEEQEEPQVSNEAFNLNEIDCALDDIDLIDT